MKEISVPSNTVTIYIAGDVDMARESLRRVCMSDAQTPGLCVTVTPTTFVYVGGVEDGVSIGLVNYPRFPESPEDLLRRARDIVSVLLVDLCQWTALIVSPIETIWISRRPDNQR